MDYWDPFDRRRRLLERQRQRMAEEAARAEEERRRHRQPPQPPQGNTPPGVSPAFMERFEQELAKARRERDEWADRYKTLMESLSAQQEALAEQQAQLQQAEEEQRARAKEEAEQQRERVQRNAEQRAFAETKEILARLLEVADNFDRVLAQSAPEGDPFAEGVRLTYRDFRRALALAGVERVESLGAPFDPTVHEAVAQLQRAGAEAGTVIEEVAAGYLYKGALLRPARVIVAA